VIGVHSPEFSFEKSIDNVRWAAKDMRVAYPIAIDNERAIWNGLNNEYWPALYFVDAKGKVRHSQFGEGEYEASERVIQTLLAEAGATRFGNELVSVDANGAEAAADWNNLRSGENYLGYGRTERFASSGSAPDMNHVYSVPAKLRLDQWALSGEWGIGRESILSTQSNGHIAYRFHARDLHLVMGPATTPGIPVKFRVLIDGHPPENAHGVDVDSYGNGTLIEPRMYQLIRQPAPIDDRQFEIEFLAPGVAAFSFTFG
jgi:hypothetical protein